MRGEVSACGGEEGDSSTFGVMPSPCADASVVVVGLDSLLVRGRGESGTRRIFGEPCGLAAGTCRVSMFAWVSCLSTMAGGGLSDLGDLGDLGERPNERGEPGYDFVIPDCSMRLSRD